MDTAFQPQTRIQSKRSAAARILEHSRFLNGIEAAVGHSGNFFDYLYGTVVDHLLLHQRSNAGRSATLHKAQSDPGWRWREQQAMTRRGDHQAATRHYCVYPQYFVQDSQYLNGKYQLAPS